MPARGLAAAAVLFLLLPGMAEAVVEIAWWHAMQGERGRQLEKLASDFNASQEEYVVNPVYKGNYTETMTGRSPRSGPASSRTSCRCSRSAPRP